MVLVSPYTKEWLNIFYSRGRKNSLSVVLTCNPMFSSSIFSCTLIYTFFIILLYIRCQFCQVALMPISYCISHSELNGDVTPGIRLWHTFWDKEAQRLVKKPKQRLKQTNVTDHSWFAGILFILLISADSKILSKKSFEFDTISF